LPGPIPAAAETKSPGAKRSLCIGAAVVVTLAFLVGGARAEPSPKASPLSPAEERQTFRLADSELTVELVAAEPDVVSPVALAWDEDGRMYVAEMSDYPTGPQGGRIKLLWDQGADGRYRKATVLADKLPFPNGVLPWKGGVLVTAAPNIWYLKDTRGDGRADEQRVVLTGFHEGNQQLRANGLVWGLDNWVYGANGRSDGEVRRPDQPRSKAVSIRRRDFRFKPETGEVEAVAGPSQFGLARDDWGNRFLSWNTMPFRHVVLEDRYLSRNPYLGASGVANIADPSDPGRVYRVSRAPQTFNREPVEFFNASCGNTIYRGDLLGAAYQGNTFVCEPLTNLVQRRRLEPAGATFVARRVEPGKEFLASTDSWFHPVNLATGPDGALYVADFYRQWVEHLQFVPEGLRGKFDWRKGWQHGRIWRVRHKDARPGAAPRLSKASRADLVKHLGHANGWWRDTAQRLLIERQDRQAVPLLCEAARKAAQPLARVHALWALQGLKALTDEVLLAALKDRHAGVREQAMQLAVGGHGWIRSGALYEPVLNLANDPELRVRLRVALFLANDPFHDAQWNLAKIANRDSADPWMRTAILSGLLTGGRLGFDILLRNHPEWLRRPTPGQLDFLSQVGLVAGRATTKGDLPFRSLIVRQEPSSVPGRLALLAGLGEGLARSQRVLLWSFVAKVPSHKKKEWAEGLNRLCETAHRIAFADKDALELRVLAVRVLSLGRPEQEGKHLLALLRPEQPPAVQSAAARGLGQLGDRGLAAQALAGWDRYTITIRRELIGSLLRSPELAACVVEAMERGKLGPADLDPAAREVLQRIPDAALQQRVRKALPPAASADREAVVRKYQAALKLKGDAPRGAALFAKHCMTCHQVQGKGQRVGPDLSGVGSRPREALLVDLLDPSREVPPDYLNFLLVTKRGQVLTGILASETAAAVTLRRAEGQEDTVPRSEIQELRATQKSLMPEGLEQVLSLQDVADLLQFLQQPARSPVTPAGE
jgi:putative membrane-bound dehydrogenase-like protein